MRGESTKKPLAPALLAGDDSACTGGSGDDVKGGAFARELFEEKGRVVDGEKVGARGLRIDGVGADANNDGALGEDVIAFDGNVGVALGGVENIDELTVPDEIHVD